MQFAPALQHATLLKRYKRFLADIELADGQQLTIHCPNTGSMKNCAEPGFQVFYSDSNNPKRKYRHTWELAKDHQGHWIGINTHNANALVAEAIESGVIQEFNQIQSIQRDQKNGDESSKIDLLVTDTLGRHFIEVKSVTLLEHDGVGYFPDAVSTRGQKHLRELMSVVDAGEQAWLIFCVQHSGIDKVRPAAHIDPDYANLFKQAAAHGVNIRAYQADFSEFKVELARELTVEL